MLASKSKTFSAAKIVIVLLCVVVVAGAMLVVLGPVPVLPFKAGMYAREVANRSGDRGQAAKNLLSLGFTALPHARKMLASDEYTTRYYGLSIIKQLREDNEGHEHDAEFEKAADEIVDMIAREDVPRNRTWALVTLTRVCFGRCDYVAKVVKYLDDPAEEVRQQMGGTMQALLNEYLPDHDAQWWKQWYEEHKDEVEAKAKQLKSGQLTAPSLSPQHKTFVPSEPAAVKPPADAPQGKNN